MLETRNYTKAIRDNFSSHYLFLLLLLVFFSLNQFSNEDMILALAGQFHLRLHFKARLSAKSLLWKSVFIHIEIGSNYHKNFALTLALKERLKANSEMTYLSNCLMNLRNTGDSTGLEPMTPAMPVQCCRSWVRIPLSHLNFSGSWDNCLNCPASARIISLFDFKHRTSYNISFLISVVIIPGCVPF